MSGLFARDSEAERWLSVLLRSAHLVGVVWLGAQLLGAPLAGHGAGALVLGSGLVMLVMDLRAGGPELTAEARRLLRPGGALVIMHFDWIPLPGNVVQRTEALIMQHNPAWQLGGGVGIYPQWFRDAGEAGFVGIESFTYDEPAIYSHAAWRGCVRASAPIGGSLPAWRQWEPAIRSLVDGRPI